MRRKPPREVQVAITELDDDGLGVGAFESRGVRAKNALPGETVNAKVLMRRSGVWYAEAAAPTQAAQTRREPPCGNYPRCGGCSLQHLDYDRQLAHKHDVLRRALGDVGVRPRRFRAPVSGPQLHYRHKARLGVRAVGDELLAGFRESFSNRVARIDECLTLAVPFARMLPDLKATLARLSRPNRIPQIELAAGDREAAIVIRHLTPLDERDRHLLAAFAVRTGIHVYLQPGGYDTVAPLAGERGDTLSYTNADFGVCLRFRPTDFTQVNPWMNRVLVRNAVLALEPLAGTRVCDLFCGIGNFSLALARRGAHVLGVENAAGAVARANDNAARNGLSGQAEFVVADLYDARCFELPDGADRLLLDPPRSGAGPNLERWARSPGLLRIAYVSCNPRSFATDAARLAASGFELEEAGVYDMFPHTAHVETLGVFSRSPGHAGG